jgi:primosomal protein N'
VFSHIDASTDSEIVIATQVVLPYRYQFDATIIISIESFLAAPTYTADEDALRLMLYLREQTKEHLIIQTLLPKESEPLTTLALGEITTFMKQEIALRRALKLPPETIYITLVTKGKREDVIEEVRTMLEVLAPLRPRAFKDLVRLSPTVVSHTTLIRTESKSWPDENVVALLRSISPCFDIQIRTG